jgi:hypothetical protein
MFEGSYIMFDLGYINGTRAILSVWCRRNCWNFEKVSYPNFCRHLTNVGSKFAFCVIFALFLPPDSVTSYGYPTFEPCFLRLLVFSTAFSHQKSNTRL